MSQQENRGRVRDLTQGPVTRSMLLFALPMIAGNLLQQFYNIADTLIVGRFLGSGALAAVGSSYSVMTFVTSILLGLSMGSGVLFSMLFGAGRMEDLRKSFVISFGFIGAIALVIEAATLVFLDPILVLLQIPADIYAETREYLFIIFIGTVFTFLYNYFASLLRAVGNSSAPLFFLAVAAVLNVALDLFLVVVVKMGVAGAALATIIAQAVSAAGIGWYALAKMPALRPGREHFRFDRRILRQIAQYSLLTCVQQSVMNFGILMVQGLVNSFGVSVMAAFAAAVKIDSFAYMPVQDFGNAFSTFIAQNYGAGRYDRIRRGTRSAVAVSMLFGAAVSAVVFVLARPLMLIFVQPEETEILAVGVQYLRTEGAFYCLIALLFLLYGFYRAIERPGMSVVLTVISLGLRVVLAYALSAIPALGAAGIWVSIPIGWVIADGAGCLPMAKFFRTLPREKKQ